ncbi:MAG: CpsD/CapB family tyrosine-protein kinase [Clostridia bacterium]|nr:CpsD/CapB family tyrosine-protein kinase [Clostridia bacterium]
MSRKKEKNVYLNTRLLDENTPFAVREAFNQLRTNLMYTVTEQDCAPIFAVTSADEGEGKSNTIANLALSFAQISKKVLLIDGDLRCPTQYRIFSLDRNHVGLSELITGIETDVIQKDVQPGLDIILSGRIPPNPSELITSPQFVTRLAELRSQYDIIFIDFPPIGIVADAVAVCKNISGYIFTIRSGKDSSKKIESAVDAMEQVGAKIVGIVLNDYGLKGGGKYNYATSRYGQVNSRYEHSATEARKQAQSEEAKK